MTAFHRYPLESPAPCQGDPLTVVGAGPAGLAAAITLARAGREVVVHEARTEVGARFGGDLQGLENWSSQGDVLQWLAQSGITTRFRTLSCTQGVLFDAWNTAYEIHSEIPLLYLLERGPGAGSLDRALLAQAQALGVTVLFKSRQQSLQGPGILATGPTRTDAIAVGYHFETSMADGFWAILDDRIAPKGYAYLLVMQGRGTLKSCMFAKFRHRNLYIARTLARFQQLLGLKMRNPRPHGGVGNFRMPASALSGQHPVVGEQAGFQDAFAGFGMRHAIRSGILGAYAMVDGAGYDAACRQHLWPSVQSAFANRAIYGLMGNHGYRWLLRRRAFHKDPRGFLHRLYGPSRIRRLPFWAQRPFQVPPAAHGCTSPNCDCVVCRCDTHAK